MILIPVAFFLAILIMKDQVFAATTGNNNSILPGINLNLGTASTPAGVDGTIQLILLLTVLSLAPAILVLMTSFTRIIIVLGFVRNALSLQNTPPNQVLIGLALFITLFIMQPVLTQANNNALQPYLKGDISQTVALQRAELPFKEFMGRETRTSDIQVFLNYRHEKMPTKVQDLPMSILVPAYTISELKTGFQIGFMIYIPFLLIDLIVATTLMSMGMMMLPPTMISLPFKILLFILVNGWNLIIQSILSGYSH